MCAALQAAQPVPHRLPKTAKVKGTVYSHSGSHRRRNQYIVTNFIVSLITCLGLEFFLNTRKLEISEVPGGDIKSSFTNFLQREPLLF